MTSYGKLFRRIREQKNLSLTYFERLGINPGNLSKFERGQTMMDFSRVDSMLQAMDVSLAEYELMLHHFTPNFQELFLEAVEQANFAQDKRRLNALYDEASRDFYPLLALTAKACYSTLEAGEINLILKRLDNSLHWGYFELSLIYFTMEQLQTKDLKRLLSDFDQKHQHFYNILAYRRRLLQVACQLIILLSWREEQALAGKILKKLEGRNRNSIDFYIDTLCKLASATYRCCFEAPQYGRQEIRATLDIMNQLEQKDLRDFYEQKLAQILGE
ncbi:Rgg/GadR/MutR family transcriptional regulator [Lactococcus termiticola]|uniref:XRE family transcriptional regulator n=1 Tax=Lactococcus termiticola TaxID=2169526 RepID=A0A2R5HDN6_9LACT|nr:Rgg/GadR/MutR family transcriptional regulator [Lactococcus termiticola]GBG96132.1 XRE family transcriptional regulator [Lactococcus termiticola]